MATRVFLVRHGETEWNASRRIQGQQDEPLNARGLEQANAVARHLAGEPLSAVYASDLRRASQTAAAVAAPRGLVVREDTRLREADFGEWEGLDEAQIMARYPKEHLLWRMDSLRHRPPGGETLQDLRRRATAAYEEIAARHAGQTVAVVAHAGALRVLVACVLGAPLAAYPRLRLRNASVSLVEIGARGPVLALYNHVCHLRSPCG